MRSGEVTIPDPHIDRDPPFDQSHTVTVQKRLEIKLSTATVIMLFEFQHQVDEELYATNYEYMQYINSNSV